MSVGAAGLGQLLPALVYWVSPLIPSQETMWTKNATDSSRKSHL